jgi:hypothetical protein
MYAKFGSDRFRNVNLYKVQTNKQTNKHSALYIWLGKVMSVAFNKKYVIANCVLLSTVISALFCLDIAFRKYDV